MTYLSCHLLTFVLFQLTSSQGGWRCNKWTEWKDKFFNSHPHKEDDSLLLIHLSNMYFFNSHPHKEDDVESEADWTDAETFQLTSSQGGWHLKNFFCSYRYNFQLTSSQGGWRSMAMVCALHPYFSTHILTRRMTKEDAYNDRRYVFQLTSSQGGWPTFS